MITYNNFLDSPFNNWQQIDIIVSRDCTLRCTYCYLHKNKESTYDMDAIINGLDTILSTCDTEGVVLSFYPEPWVNIERTNELILRSLETLVKYPKFASNFMIMLGTNGVNLHKQIPVLEHLLERLSINVTIDGVKEQHDMYRVFPDGSPSWEIVKKNILDNQEKYNIYSTKVTLGPDTLKYIYESSLFLWDEMNMTDINMNVVFEDVWKNENESLEIFEDQLNKLFNDVVKNERWTHQYVGLLGSRNIPSFQLYNEGHLKDNYSNKTYCGAAVMRSIDTDGMIYPCFRMSPYSIADNKQFNINNSESKRSLKLINNLDASLPKCDKCPLLTACPMCVGGAYEESNSLFWRTTHHCNFQKLQYCYSVKLHNIMNPSEQIQPLEIP